MYILHSRHGQIFGTHFLIFLLKMSTDLEDLMFSGINSGFCSKIERRFIL